MLLQTEKVIAKLTDTDSVLLKNEIQILFTYEKSDRIIYLCYHGF